jgi:hypothetical protein
MTNKDKQLAESTCDDVFEINNDRQTVIHSSFEPAAGALGLPNDFDNFRPTE